MLVDVTISVCGLQVPSPPRISSYQSVVVDAEVLSVKEKYSSLNTYGGNYKTNPLFLKLFYYVFLKYHTIKTLQHICTCGCKFSYGIFVWYFSSLQRHVCSVTRTYLWGKALSFSLSELNEDALEQSHRGWRMVVQRPSRDLVVPLGQLEMVTN